MTGASAKSKSKQHGFYKFLLLLAGAVLLLVSYWLSHHAYRMNENRLVLENTTISWVNALLPGVSAVVGEAAKLQHELIAPLTMQPALYYRKLVERQSRDSEGRTNWSVMSDDAAQVPMQVVDATGALTVLGEGATFRTKQVYREMSGNIRTTVYAIYPGDSLYVFGHFDGMAFRTSATGLPLVLANVGEDVYINEVGYLFFLLFLLALAAGTFAVFFIAMAMQISHLFFYLTALSLVIATYLLTQWFLLTGQQISFWHERVAASYHSVAQEPPDTLKAALMKQTLNSYIAIYQRLISDGFNRVPVIFYRPPRVAPIALTAHERALVQEYPLRQPQSFTLPSWLALLALGLGTLLFLVSFKFCFRKLLVKRMIENIPTTTARAAMVGLNELEGKVEFAANGPIHSRYRKTNCVWCRYKKETRGAKNKWTVAETGQIGTPFYLADHSGKILVDPMGASVSVAGNPWVSRIGGQRLTEWIITEGEDVYLLGPASLRHPEDKNLTISRSEVDPTFVVATKSQGEVMLGYARLGFLLLNLAMILATATTLTVLAVNGLSSSDILISGLVPFFIMAFAMVVFLYNDLVFLRNRVRRSLAMVDVALKKRADLLPNLIKMIEGIFDHEVAVQTQLALSRAAPTELAALRSGQGNLGHFRALIENYPVLKASKPIEELMTQLSEVENEISFARAGYNDAVQKYNDRIQTVPETFIARWNDMGPAQYYRN